jgi:hypothetical protein
MSSEHTAPGAADHLVEIVQLKWLLAGHGISLHVERLQTDPDYACRLLDRAATTPNPALREAAFRLRVCLGLNR